MAEATRTSALCDARRRSRPGFTVAEARSPRAYISQFLEQQSADIRGRALEIASDRYIAQYGRGVTQIDILDINPQNTDATFVADFGDAPVEPR